jgi:hypothetical protein
MWSMQIFAAVSNKLTYVADISFNGCYARKLITDFYLSTCIAYLLMASQYRFGNLKESMCQVLPRISY